MFATLLRPLLWGTAALGAIATLVALGTSGRASAPAASVAPAPRQTSVDADNPRVEPGLVKWHANFADACAAAEQSGKRVLLFHMMGQLDKQFC
jgi:hypothetical protein